MHLIDQSIFNKVAQHNHLNQSLGAAERPTRGSGQGWGRGRGRGRGRGQGQGRVIFENVLPKYGLP